MYPPHRRGGPPGEMAALLSESAGLGAAFGTLVCFFITTCLFAYSTRGKGFDEDSVWLRQRPPPTAMRALSPFRRPRQYMSARNTQGVLSLTLSLSMGKFPSVLAYEPIYSTVVKSYALWLPSTILRETVVPPSFVPLWISMTSFVWSIVFAMILAAS